MPSPGNFCSYPLVSPRTSCQLLLHLPYHPERPVNYPYTFLPYQTVRVHQPVRTALTATLQSLGPWRMCAIIWKFFLVNTISSFIILGWLIAPEDRTLLGARRTKVGLVFESKEDCESQSRPRDFNIHHRHECCQVEENGSCYWTRSTISSDIPTAPKGKVESVLQTVWYKSAFRNLGLRLRRNWHSLQGATGRACWKPQEERQRGFVGGWAIQSTW